MLYNHSSGSNGTDGDGGGAWCSIWAQQRARASRPCCPPLFQPFWPPGCKQPLPGRSRPWTHGGPAAPWLSAGPGARTPPQLAGLGKGPNWAVRPFLRESGCPWGLLTITSTGRAGPKESGGEAGGTGCPLRWTCWARDAHQGHCSWNQPWDCREQQLSLGTLGPQTSSRGPKWQTISLAVSSPS